MPDLTKSILKFDGEPDSDSEAWINTIDGMQTLHNWPDAFALEIARTHLVGGAKKWYQRCSSTLYTWELFKETFKRTF